MLGSRWSMPGGGAFVRLERPGRERFDGYRYGPEIYYDFEDQAYDPRYQRSPSGIAYPEYVGGRGLGGRQGFGGRETGRRGLEPQYRFAQPSSKMATGGKDGIGFQKAISKLFKQVQKAEATYGHFRDEFDDEVGQVKKYIASDVYESLWQSKLAGKSDKKVYQESDDATDAEETQVQFDEVETALVPALNAAVQAMISEKGSSPRSKNRVDFFLRLQEKVRMAQVQIVELLEKAGNSHEDCESFLTELGLLKTLVDPDQPHNKDLKLGDSGDGGSGSEGGSQAQENGAENGWD